MDLIDGMRVQNGSVKIYKLDDSKFLVVCRKYFMGIPYQVKKIVVADYEAAEDYLLKMKFEKSSIM